MTLDLRHYEGPKAGAGNPQMDRRGR